MGESAEEVPLVDLQAQRRRLGPRIDDAIATVLEHGQFVLGPEVGRLEAALAQLCQVDHAIGCSSGTDALLMAVLALGAGPGDAVLVPAFTFAATAEVVVLAGATPVFVDVHPLSFNVDAARLHAGRDGARRAGLRPVGIIAVDLFGQPADYDAIGAFAADAGLWVVADGAQSLGAQLNGRPVGSLAAISATSFFPAKPLGCYGDGGAAFTDDAVLAGRLRSLGVHGRAEDTYDNVLVGLNARLDTLQAAILLAKLTVFPDELRRRQRVAARYRDALADVVGVPGLIPGASSAWACYTVLVAGRDAVRGSLRRQGIASAVYYPRPLHHQTAYRRFPVADGGLPVCEQLGTEVLSLPVHPYLDEATQDRVIRVVRATAGAAP